MRIIRDTISIGLVTSGLIGTQILVTDKWLWAAAPTHAIGLLGFVVIELALGLAVWWRTVAATVGSAFASGAQLVAMLADITIGQPMGVAASAFRIYLLSDISYLILLAFQLALLTIAVAGLASPLFHRHGRWATLPQTTKR